MAQVTKEQAEALTQVYLLEQPRLVTKLMKSCGISRGEAMCLLDSFMRRNVTSVI